MSTGPIKRRTHHIPFLFRHFFQAFSIVDILSRSVSFFSPYRHRKVYSWILSQITQEKRTANACGAYSSFKEFNVIRILVIHMCRSILITIFLRSRIHVTILDRSKALFFRVFHFHLKIIQSTCTDISLYWATFRFSFIYYLIQSKFWNKIDIFRWCLRLQHLPPSMLSYYVLQYSNWWKKWYKINYVAASGKQRQQLSVWVWHNIKWKHFGKNRMMGIARARLPFNKSGFIDYIVQTYVVLLLHSQLSQALSTTETV